MQPTVLVASVQLKAAKRAQPKEELHYKGRLPYSSFYCLMDFFGQFIHQRPSERIVVSSLQGKCIFLMVEF